MSETQITIPPEFVRVESKIQGITVFAPPPRLEQLPNAQTFNCPNCGATTAFDPRAASVLCSNCGSRYKIESTSVGRQAAEFQFTLDTVNHDARGWGATRRDLHCENCGATVSVAPTELSTTCPFCGSNHVAARTETPTTFRPRVLIPFKIERAACTALARAWLAKGWFYPRALVHAARRAYFSGIYLPYWTFSARVNAQWRAEVGEMKTETYFDWHDAKFKTREVLVWQWREGTVSSFFNDELEIGTQRVSANFSKKLAPFDLDALVTYDPAYLAGWQAQTHEIALDTAWDQARATMRERTRAACYDDIHSKFIRNFTLRADFDEEAWRALLLPVFIATYPFQNKTFQVLVNGQTGEVVGEKPIDWRKVIGALLAALAPGFLLMSAGIVLGAVWENASALFCVGALLLVVGALAAAAIVRQVQSSQT